ncbi:hypothetical protein QE152_g39847 [Popillia japonica]|uniref:Uncharacterized protein n=1 Tax=Popillia japonica TaxID=7064 RepID=A0AAW1HT16_POPJA
MDGILSEFEAEMAGLIVEEEEAEQGQQQGDVMMDDHDRRVPPGDGCAAVHCSLNGMFSEDDDVFVNLVVVEEQEQEQQQQQQDGSHAVEEAAGDDVDSDGASAAAVREDTSVTCRTTPRYSVTMLVNAIRTTTMRHNFLKLFRPFADLVSYCITIDELDDTIENNTQTTTTTTTDVCNKVLRRRRGQDDDKYGDDDHLENYNLGQDDDKYGDDDHLENYNLHAFLEFDTDHFCWDIRGLLKRNYDNARIASTIAIDVVFYGGTCETINNDRFVLTNVIRECPNRDRCRFLRRYLRDYQRQNVTLRDVIEQETDVDESVFYSEINVCYENWTKDVCRWWNKMMVYCRRRGRRRRWSTVVARVRTAVAVVVDYSNRCLYLYGSTAASKSTYVQTILSAAGSRRSHNPLRHVYYPGVGRYFMRHFDVDFHRAIVFEEFDVG